MKCDYGLINLIRYALLVYSPQFTDVIFEVRSVKSRKNNISLRMYSYIYILHQHPYNPVRLSAN